MKGEVFLYSIYIYIYTYMCIIFLFRRVTVDVLFLQLHWLANLRHEQVEQTVEVPVPMTQEEVVHVPTVTR